MLILQKVSVSDSPVLLQQQHSPNETNMHTHITVTRGTVETNVHTESHACPGRVLGTTVEALFIFFAE